MYAATFGPSIPDYIDFLRASQNATVRFDIDKTPADIKGLCTDGTSACLSIIIVSQDKKRMSLTHTDLVVNSLAIAKECEWAGDHCTLYIIKGLDYYRHTVGPFESTTLPRFRKSLSSLSFHVNIDTASYPDLAWATAIDRRAIITTQHDKVRLGKTAPAIEFRHVRNMFQFNVECHFHPDHYHDLDLQFDAEEWTEIPPLSEMASTKLDRFSRGAESVPPALLADTKNYISDRERAKAQSARLSEEAQQFYKDRAYKKAIEQFYVALQLHRLFFGNRDKGTVTLYYFLGLAYKGNLNYREAANCFRQSLEFYPTVFAPTGKKAEELRSLIQECEAALVAPMQARSGGAAAASSAPA